MFLTAPRLAEKALGYVYKATQTSLMHAVRPMMKTTKPEDKRTKWSPTNKWRCLPARNYHKLHSRVMAHFPKDWIPWDFKGLELDPDHPRYPLPPLKPYNFDFLQRKLKCMAVGSKALRTIDKHGGIDNYLLRTPDRELGAAGIRMRQELKQAIEILKEKIESDETSPELKQKYIDSLPSSDTRRDHRVWLLPIKKDMRVSADAASQDGIMQARLSLKDKLTSLQNSNSGSMPAYLKQAITSVTASSEA